MTATEAMFRGLADELAAGLNSITWSALALEEAPTVAREGAALALADDALLALGEILVAPPRVLKAPPGTLSWAALAVRREPLPRILVAYDWTGLIALFYERRTRLARAITRSKIRGAGSRADRAREQLGPDADAAIAAGVATYLASQSALEDDGWPLRSWMVVELDPAKRTIRVVAEEPDAKLDHPSSRSRRAQLFEAALNELEADAFGHGINSSRARTKHASLDTGDEDARSLLETEPGGIDPARAVEARLDLRLLDTLPERQRRILLLTAEGWSDAEVATELGMTVAAVRMNRSRARVAFKKKLAG